MTPLKSQWIWTFKVCVCLGYLYTCSVLFFFLFYCWKQITALKSCVWFYSVPTVKNLHAHPVCHSIRGLGKAHLTDCFDRCQPIQLRRAEMTQTQGNAASQEVLYKCTNMLIRAAGTCGLSPLSLYFVFTTVTAVISVLIFRSNVLNPDTIIISAIGFGLCKSQYLCWMNLLSSIIPVFCEHIAYSFRQMFEPPPPKRLCDATAQPSPRISFVCC